MWPLTKQKQTLMQVTVGGSGFVIPFSSRNNTPKTTLFKVYRGTPINIEQQMLYSVLARKNLEVSKFFKEILKCCINVMFESCGVFLAQGCFYVLYSGVLPKTRNIKEVRILLQHPVFFSTKIFCCYCFHNKFVLPEGYFVLKVYTYLPRDSRVPKTYVFEISNL